MRFLARQLPLFRLLAAAQVALLVRRHLRQLDPFERRRLAELVRRGHRLDRAERRELRTLAAKLEPAAFVRAAAAHVSPLPRRFR